MRKFIVRLLPFLVFCFVLVFVFPIVIDPYNVFHYKKIRDNGIEPNKNYIKMRYILDNPTLFDSYLFGSSRVSFIDVNSIENINCYNMTYSEGTPAEHFENLKTMIKNNIIPAVVILGVDNISCFVNPASHKGQLLRTPPPPAAKSSRYLAYFSKISEISSYFEFFIKYCDPRMVFSSLETTLAYKESTEQKRQNVERFYKNGGSPRSVPDGSYDWETALPSWGRYRKRIDETLLDISGIAALCRKNNIKLIVFTNPVHKITYQKSVENGYLDFLYKLSGITEYYNFSGLNDITVNNSNYFETSHYSTAVGDMIINAIFHGITDDRLLSQGFGYYVTKSNRDAFFDILKIQQEKLRGDGKHAL